TPLYDAAERLMTAPGWERRVREASNLDKAFLSNAFDDPLDGFDTQRYVPCLAADELVFRLDDAAVRQRLERVCGVEVGEPVGLQHGLATRLDHFQRRGARAVRLVVPPNFAPRAVSDADLAHALAGCVHADGPVPAEVRRLAAYGAFRMLVE